MRFLRLFNMAALGLALAVSASPAQAQQTERDRGGRSDRPAAEARPRGDLPGPIDSLEDLEETLKAFFRMADTDNNGRISEKEAVDVGNLMVGGFFFRADTDGDGTLTREEARQARDSLLKQNPGLRAIAEQLQENREGEGRDSFTPVRDLANLLDGNDDRKLQATELRKAVQTAVAGIYDAADTNRDRELSPDEIRTAAEGLGREAAQAAFQAADQDNNGALSQEEFERAIIEPARAVFSAIDADGDNQITPEEARAAQRVFQEQMRALRGMRGGNRQGGANRDRDGGSPAPNTRDRDRPVRTPDPNPRVDSGPDRDPDSPSDQPRP